MKNYVGFFLLFIFLGFGCAAITKERYVLPDTYYAPLEFAYPFPFEKVWANTLKKLPDLEVILENLNKEAKTITLSFVASSPEKYVDCGAINLQTDTASLFQNTFKGAQSEARFYISTGDIAPQETTRKVKLSGKINIHFASEGTSQTKVTVKTFYDLDIQLEGERYSHMNHGIISTPVFNPYAINTQITFYAGQEGRGNKTISPGGLRYVFDSEGEMVCRSKFVLERIIFDAIGKPTP